MRVILTAAVLAALLPAYTNIQAQTSSRLNVSSPLQSLCRFVDYEKNAPQGRFEFNTNFWLRGVDFSCASPWNSGGGLTRAGTLISKRHIIFAKHFPLWAGVRIVFVGEDGGICPCRIAATRGVADCDIMVASLDYEVTPNIVPARILPDDYEKHLGGCAGLTIVTLNQHENAVIANLHSLPKQEDKFKMISVFESRGKTRSAFTQKLTGGDSGSPAFLIVDNQPILLYCAFRGGYGSGPAIHLRRREIQQAMDELCPGYNLERFDFTRLADRK